MDELMANYAGIVFAKTDKGREEMASRAHGLNPPQRRVLIIVDGVRNFETIVDIIPSIIPKDQMGEIFSFLLRHGYIVAVAVNAGVAMEGKDTPAEAVLPVAEQLADDPTTIRIVKDFMTTTAQTYLGLLGAGIIQRIERAKTAEQLLAVLGQWNMALHESTQGRRFAAGSLQQVKDALMGQGSFVPADARGAGKALQS